jgi:hypothetical protein
MYPLKGVRPAGALLELRSSKGFDVLPSTSEQAEIEDRQSYWHHI